MQKICTLPEEMELRRMISILMESPFYLEMSLRERLDLVRDLTERYHIAE